ncbi:hypothetical protein [Sphingomonas sp. RS2018]
MMGLFTPKPVRPGYWFARKRFGYGAVPATVAGWVATALYLLAIGAAVKVMPTDGVRIGVGVAVTIVYLWIVWMKTDGGWGWEWGGR